MRLLPGTCFRNLNSGVDREHRARGEIIGGKMNILNEKTDRFSMLNNLYINEPNRRKFDKFVFFFLVS